MVKDLVRWKIGFLNLKIIFNCSLWGNILINGIIGHEKRLGDYNLSTNQFFNELVSNLGLQRR